MRIAAIAVFVLSTTIGIDSAFAVVPVRLVIAEGQSLPGTNGLICTAPNAPFTNGIGKVGFTGSSSGGSFVWYDNRVIWLNTNAGANQLIGADKIMGISSLGGFAYNPQTSQGGRAIWTQAGRLLSPNDAIPQLPGKFSVFNYYPRMTDSGSVIWAVGIGDSRNGPDTARGFFRVANPAAPVFETLIMGGGTYGGVTIATAPEFSSAFDISGNGEHRIHKLVSSSFVEFMYLSSSDSIIATQGSAVTGSLERWIAFRTPGINNSGNWVIAGSTNAGTNPNEIVVCNNTIIARRNQLIGAHRLRGFVNALSINNRNRIACVFGGSTLTVGATMLVAGPATNFSNRAHEVLFNGCQIDVNNDGICDYIIGDFEANYQGYGLDVSDDGMIYVQVSISPCSGGPAVRAIVGVRDTCLADFNSDYEVNFSDFQDFVTAFSANAPSADFNLDGRIDFFDYLDYADAFSEGC